MLSLPEENRRTAGDSSACSCAPRWSGALLVCVLLVLVTTLCYLDLRQHAFINHDDQEYITQNPQVTAGLTWAGVAWAFTTGHASNWHPITWLSHMLDCQLYGLNPTGHHLTNLAFHVANVVLLFVLLRTLTGSLWRSGFVAAAFALHPLHVESVAWAAERKDVLSTFFFLLTLIAYTRYTWTRASTPAPPGRALNSRFSIFNFRFSIPDRPGVWYALSLALFALGLMSKPMVVTLPCVLLLLDYWPLERFQINGIKTSVRSALPFILEKVPFLLLALVASVVTYLAQSQWGATYSLERMPLFMRCENAVLAYMRYLGKTIWPSNLAVFYPYQEHWPMAAVLGAVALLLLVSVMVLALHHRHRYLLVGWSWFLGTLVPTIGLVQVGSQSMADRYMYIPSIGLFILIAWGLGSVRLPSSVRGGLAWGLASLSLGILFVCTVVQVRHWRDDEALFRHALEVTDENYFAYIHLAGASDKAGQREEALKFCLEAVRVRPAFAEGHYNAGTYLLEMGRVEEGMAHLRQALAANPRLAPAHLNLGKALVSMGRSDEAAREMAQAVGLAPENADAHYGLGTVLLRAGKPAEAEAEFGQALRLNQVKPEFHMNLAIALIQQGKRAEALAQFSETTRLAPANPEAHFNYGVALLEEGRTAEAVSQFSEVLRLQPDAPKAHYHMAGALLQLGKREEAIQRYQKTLRLAPAFPGASEALARLQGAEVVQKFKDPATTDN